MNKKQLKSFIENGFKGFLLLMIVLFSTAFQGKLDQPEEGKKIKVISYNIWNGFDWGKDEQRKEKMVAWVNSQKPDVLALQELCGYTLEKLQEDAKKWGHPYAEILKTTGYPVGITSNQPIEIKERILDNMHHGVLHCKTAGIDFIVVHFSPFSYEKRQKETKIVLTKLAEIAKSQDKYIILGDFNAVSPLDADLYKDKSDLLNSLRASEVEHDHVRNLFHGQLEFGVLSQFLSFPLIDVTQKYTTGWDERVSCPTQIFEEQKGQGRKENSKRIDYILTSPYIADHCSNAQILNQEATYYLSDHYPVMAEFEF